MNDVGVASFMQYTPNASGTQGIFAYQALLKNFDYSAAYATKAIEGPTRFAEILRQELLNGCPVYLEGRPAGAASGHAWVTDGFDENGLFHMNFGWEGQGDAYYSLTNLSVSQTGSEFQGKPLAFNRAIMAILAHPDNGKYPEIDRSLLENSPQLMFNEGGSLLIKEATGKNFNPSQTITVEMNSFVNRGKPFQGDIGVAVYDVDGNLIQVAYSDDHAQGGFTQRIYGADHAGWMGNDYLINEAQPVKLNLSGLKDGYYRLLPVCVARKEDQSWDEFFLMKKAPVIEVELKDGTGRISEIYSEEPHFQLMSQPRLIGRAAQGGKVQAFFSLKNLNGVPRDCYLRVQLLNDSREVVMDTRVDQLSEIEGFTETEIPILLSLPSNLSPGCYEVKLIISGDEAETIFYPVNLIHDREAAFIQVEKAQEKPLMVKAEVFLADDSHEKIKSGSIDMTKYANFKLGVSLLASEGRSYEGRITLMGEDTETKEKIQVRGIDDEVSVSSTFEVPLYSYWLRKNNLPFADGHTYRMRVMGEIEGKEIELGNPQGPVYYLKRKGDLLAISQDTSTGIGASVNAAPSIDVRLESHQLSVSCSGLRNIKLYQISGSLLKQSEKINGNQASLSLQGIPAGIYLLRIVTDKQIFTYHVAKK